MHHPTLIDIILELGQLSCCCLTARARAQTRTPYTFAHSSGNFDAVYLVKHTQIGSRPYLIPVMDGSVQIYLKEQNMFLIQ